MFAKKRKKKLFFKVCICIFLNKIGKKMLEHLVFTWLKETSGGGVNIFLRRYRRRRYLNGGSKYFYKDPRENRSLIVEYASKTILTYCQKRVRWKNY
jgi:hypothetical protein